MLHAKKDPSSLPARERAKYRAAAKNIIALWVKWMKEDPEMAHMTPYVPKGVVYNRQPGRFTIRKWLKAAAKNASCMHDNCDANMVFDEVLRKHGLIDDRMLDEFPEGRGQQMDAWNAVTYDYDFLEEAAKAALKRGTTKRTKRSR